MSKEEIAKFADQELDKMKAAREEAIKAPFADLHWQTPARFREEKGQKDTRFTVKIAERSSRGPSGMIVTIRASIASKMLAIASVNGAENGRRGTVATGSTPRRKEGGAIPFPPPFLYLKRSWIEAWMLISPRARLMEPVSCMAAEAAEPPGNGTVAPTASSRSS